MLDYLLIQPEAQGLWQYNQPETLRYLVVDEFHTFDGAQGNDLACLLRRLKHRLQTPKAHLACVGTSATLGNSDSKQEMLTYASQIFQETFDELAVIEEARLSAGEFLADALLNVLPVPPIGGLNFVPTACGLIYPMLPNVRVAIAIARLACSFPTVTKMSPTRGKNTRSPITIVPFVIAVADYQF